MNWLHKIFPSVFQPTTEQNPPTQEDNRTSGFFNNLFSKLRKSPSSDAIILNPTANSSNNTSNKTILLWTRLFRAKEAVGSEHVTEATTSSSPEPLTQDEINSLSETNINEEIRGGLTPLQLACHYGYSDIVNRFLNFKQIDINKKGSNGVIPLFEAANKGHLDVVVSLLKAGATLPKEISLENLKAIKKTTLQEPSYTAIIAFFNLPSNPLATEAWKKKWLEKKHS